MKLPRMKPADLVVVKLTDLTNYGGWLTDDQAQDYEAKGVLICGWFINKDKACVRISSIINEKGDKTITVIPRGSIQEIKVIPYDRS